MVRTHQILFPHDKENINTNSKHLIQHGDLVIAEVSQPSTGQGIELGWANESNTKILCIYMVGSKISSSLKFVASDFIEYDNQADMLHKLNTWMKANIKRTQL